MAKFVVAGGFGVGKTTFIGAVSEIRPLTTEETLTAAGSTTDSLAGVEGKTTTTVSMDFGRITFQAQRHLIVYLFGTPGQERFQSTWPDLAEGAIGAVVLVDTRRLDDSFLALSFFEQTGVPFVVAVNEFAGNPYTYSPGEVSRALALPTHVPVLLCDARDRSRAKDVLLALVDHALVLARTIPGPLDAPTPSVSHARPFRTGPHS